jgi:hypothetical protein
VTTVGIGNNINVETLFHMSDHFLHVPDPGSVGPFLVNLCARVKSQATWGGITLANTKLVLHPASAVAHVYGFKLNEVRESQGVVIPITTFLSNGVYDFVVDVHPGENVTAVLSTASGDFPVTDSTPWAQAPQSELTMRKLDLMVVEEILKGITAARSGKEYTIQPFLHCFRQAGVETDGNPMVDSLQNEVVTGLKRDVFLRWGWPYTRSLWYVRNDLFGSRVQICKPPTTAPFVEERKPSA